MTSGSLYFKLLKEDFRRRLWAIALVFLAFFFTLPIGLALNMENAANTNYYRYNDYEPFIQDAAMTDLQYKTRLLELKTEVVLNGVEYGNGMIAFLMITAAVVIGVSSFAYLHNKKSGFLPQYSGEAGGAVWGPVLRRHIYCRRCLWSEPAAYRGGHVLRRACGQDTGRHGRWLGS